MLNPLRTLRLPVPVDPERPDGATRLVDGELVVSKLFEMAHHLAAISESTRAVEARENRGRASLLVRIPAINTFQDGSFDPVPQGRVWNITRITALYAGYLTNGPNKVVALAFRNAPTPDMFVGALDGTQTDPWAAAGGATILQLQLATPITLTSGERLCINAFFNSGALATLDLYVNIEYVEISPGPLTIDLT